MAIIITGIGTPEGVIAASLGTFYIDTEDTSVYIKLSENEKSTNGWAFINHRGFIEGYENPTEDAVSAVRGVIYYNSTNKQLFMQMTESTMAQEDGWVAINEVLHGKTDPDSAGVNGVLYINTTYFTVYLYANDMWTRLSLLNIKQESIFRNLSELLTNSVTLANTAYDMFYNNTPLDLHMSHYDSNGTLHNVDMPNRAKDTNTLLGEGSPEGEVYATLGKFYVDTTEGSNTMIYVKTTDVDSNLGWARVTVPTASLPLVHSLENNSYSISTDSLPTENSVNMVDSGTLYTQFLNKADKEGNKDINFKAAYPIDDNDVASKEYVDSLYNSLLNRIKALEGNGS